jgi:Protein of unknown function (DUF1420)
LNAFYAATNPVGRSSALHLVPDIGGVVSCPVSGIVFGHRVAKSADIMALIGGLAALLATGLLGLIWAALGYRLLKWFGLNFDSTSELLLCAVAVGVVLVEDTLFLGQLAPVPRLGIALVLAVSLIVGARDIPAILRSMVKLARALAAGSRGERFLVSLAALVLAFEGISAMAPVTGSDALQYHFATPLQILQAGFHPNFFVVHSFFCGQGHLLILAGLALGSDKLAMGLLFLGGALSAAAVACLARLWMSRSWALLLAISFLVTPVVFWQASSAGAPDIWMCFFATLGVVVLARMGRNPRPGHAALVGILAGALAGAKYSGCFVALSLAIAFLWEARSLRGAVLFFGSALCAGIGPFARNLVWTGDPMFPYLLHWLAPDRINAYALASQKAYAGFNGPPTILELAKFSLFAAVDHSSLGFWQFLGPLPLAFAPLLFLAVRNTPVWRATLIVWLASAITIGATSRMDRFLLPVFPIVLAAVFAGVARLDSLRWPVARGVARTLVWSSVLAGVGGLILYGHAAFGAAIGITSREEYLVRKAPNYGDVEFLNGTLGEEVSREKVLVFFPHVYYLRVPYLRGNPDATWAIDPLKFQTDDEWRTLFRNEHIGWVARSPDFPAPIAQPLSRLEAEGVLVPVAEGESSDFANMRITGQRQLTRIVILRVKE